MTAVVVDMSNAGDRSERAEIAPLYDMMDVPAIETVFFLG